MLPREQIAPAAIRIVQELRDAGYEGYIVGGAVRDLLLDRQPKDFDLATAATPEQCRKVFGRRSRIIGRRFRLVHVYINQAIFELSTFRRMPSLDERKVREEDDGLMVWSDNEYGSLEDDAYRRDFTVNALYYDPLAEKREDSIIDFTGGLQDIEDGVVRAIGEPAVRLEEDPVRMLRACKLVGQYDFTLELELAEAMQELAPALSRASSARLLEELYKVLRKPHTYGVFASCRQHGILQYLLPGLDAEWDSEPGQWCQRLLQARDELLAEEKIFPSRVTGFAGIMLPFLAAEFGEGELRELWGNFGGIDRQIQDRIRDFFQPYCLPRFSVAKVRDVLLLQPKFLHGAARGRVLRHPDYERARDTFHVLVRAAGLDEELLSKWPRQRSESQSSKGPRSSGRRRRPRRRRQVRE